MWRVAVHLREQPDKANTALKEINGNISKQWWEAELWKEETSPRRYSANSCTDQSRSFMPNSPQQSLTLWRPRQLQRCPFNQALFFFFLFSKFTFKPEFKGHGDPSAPSGGQMLQLFLSLLTWCFSRNQNITKKMFSFSSPQAQQLWLHHTGKRIQNNIRCQWDYLQKKHMLTQI